MRGFFAGESPVSRGGSSVCRQTREDGNKASGSGLAGTNQRYSRHVEQFYVAKVRQRYSRKAGVAAMNQYGPSKAGMEWHGEPPKAMALPLSDTAPATFSVISNRQLPT